MPIKIAIFILFNIHSMHIDLSHINGHDNDIIPYGMDVEHIVVADNIMEHYNNLSLENIEGEIWKEVAGYGGKYLISNFARLKSNHKNKTIIKYTFAPSHEYCRTSLTFGKKKKMILIHRLVAENFIPNPLNKSTVNHINGNKKDNRLVNLEWCTLSENSKHSYDFLNRKIPNKGKYGIESKSSKPVIQYDLDMNFIKYWDSAKCAFRKLGVRHICEVAKGKMKSAGGFKWKYA